MCVIFTRECKRILRDHYQAFTGILAYKLFSPDWRGYGRMNLERYHPGRVYIDDREDEIRDYDFDGLAYKTGYHARLIDKIVVREGRVLVSTTLFESSWHEINFNTRSIVMLADIQAVDDEYVCGRTMYIFTKDELLQYLNRPKVTLPALREFVNLRDPQKRGIKAVRGVPVL